MGGKQLAYITKKLLRSKTFNQWLVRSRGRSLFCAYSQLVLVILSSPHPSTEQNPLLEWLFLLNSGLCRSKV
jgi:hypothetical protein